MKLKNGTITCSSHTYIDFDCDAGKAKVNVGLGEVIFTHDDISIGERNFNIGISHIYSNFSHLDDTNIGLNWKLNIQQYVQKYDGSIPLEGFNLGDYVYIDEMGYVHRFVKYYGSYYCDQSGIGMTLYGFKTVIIKKPDGTTLHFDSNGYLSNVLIKCKTKYISRNIEYENGFIKKYYDCRCGGKNERYFSFDYEDGLLSKISLIYKGKILENIYYKYEDCKLKAIYHFVNNALKKISLFEYENGKIISATGTNNGVALKLSYISNTIEVTKGVGSIYKNNFTCLNDGTYVGEGYSSNFIEPVVGRLASNSKNGLYINNESDILFLGTDSVIEALNNDFLLCDNYISKFNDNQIFEKTIFTYTLNHFTEIKNLKGLVYRYYYNDKNIVKSKFEVDGSNLMTLTKDLGVSISALVGDDYSYERINNKTVVVENINEKIMCLSSENLTPNFNGYLLLYNYRKDIISDCVNFYASFWLKISVNNATYLKVSFKIFHMDYIEKEIYIDHTANNVWQYISIPFSIPDDYQSKMCDFSNAFVTVKSDGIGTYKMSNFRISEGNSIKMQLIGDHLTCESPSITEYYKVKLVLKDGTNQEIVFDNFNYISESDLLSTCLSMHDDEFFEFYYSGKTKRIANVSRVFFRVYQNQSDTSLLDEYEMRGIEDIKIISKSYDNSIEKTTKYEYDDDGNLIEYIFSKSGESVEKKIDNNGKVIYETDIHGKKYVNEYDGYGNIMCVTTSLKENFDVNNNVIPGKSRLFTRYYYNDESEDGMYRESIISTETERLRYKIKNREDVINGIESMQDYDGKSIYYNYDIINRINKVSYYDYNIKIGCKEFQYDRNGQSISVKDSDKFGFRIDYKKYGNVKSYSIIRNYSPNILIKTEKTLYNESPYGGDIEIEKSESTNSTFKTFIDKYGKPIKIQFEFKNEVKNILFQYQEKNSRVTSEKFMNELYESPHLAKITKIIDGCSDEIINFLYDVNMNNYGYILSKNDSEIQRIQKLDSNTTKYTIGDTIYQVLIEKDNYVFDGRIIKTNILWNNDDDFKKIDKFCFEYDYDNLLNIPTYKHNIYCYSKAIYGSTDLLPYYNVLKQFTYVAYTKLFNYYYKYDNKQNISNIVSKDSCPNVINYLYDQISRIKNEINEKMNINYTYYYLDENNNDVNRITVVMSNNTKVREYSYDELNRLIKYKNYGQIKKELIYKDNSLVLSAIIKDGIQYPLEFYRENLLICYGNNFYKYNYQGYRVSKSTLYGNVQYYYDGDKILGEDHSNGVKIRYMYDLSGICGARYILSDLCYDYFFIKDGQGNIVAIVKDCNIVAEYYYDFFGNTLEVIKNENDNFAKINPIRWKANYYDIETNLYYIQGRYYDPELCRFISPCKVCNLNFFENQNIDFYALTNYNCHFEYDVNYNLPFYYTNNGLDKLKKYVNFMKSSYSMFIKSYDSYKFSKSLKVSMQQILFMKNYGKIFESEMKLLGVSTKKGILNLNNFSFMPTTLDIIDISLKVFYDVYDSLQRGVNLEGMLVSSSLTLIKGIGMVYLSKGVIYITTSIGTIFGGGFGGAIGFAFGSVFCFFVGDYIDEELEKIIYSIASKI